MDLVVVLAVVAVLMACLVKVVCRAQQGKDMLAVMALCRATVAVVVQELLAAVLLATTLAALAAQA